MPGMSDVPQAKPRWYRITPDRLVIGMLIVECLLWLSERFQWFAFNEHKGWTVLTGMAAVGLLVLLMLLAFVVCLLLRWRFQFSILSLLVLTVAVAISCSWLARDMKKAREQREAATGTIDLGGSVRYDYELDSGEPRGPAWLRKVLGDDFFNEVTEADLNGDAQTAHLSGLSQLQTLSLSFENITDDGLANVRGLPHLRRLGTFTTKITDKGMRYVGELTSLQELSFFGESLSDAGLKYFTGLTALKDLNTIGRTG